MKIVNRLVLIDALRGMAILMMVGYHFCYDLNYFKLAQFDFYHDSFWLNFRNFIVGSFVFIIGVSFSLATKNGINWKSFNRRLLYIAGCAMVISIFSYFMFPGRTIFFGILHFIALASVLAILFRKFYWINLVTGILIVIAAANIRLSLFNTDWLVWIGFYTKKPFTEDFTPIFPWFGIVLIGMFAGKYLLNNKAMMNIAAKFPGANQLKWLTLAGRNSLLVYMIHQPIIMGILYILTNM